MEGGRSQNLPSSWNSSLTVSQQTNVLLLQAKNKKKKKSFVDILKYQLILANWHGPGCLCSPASQPDLNVIRTESGASHVSLSKMDPFKRGLFCVGWRSVILEGLYRFKHELFNSLILTNKSCCNLQVTSAVFSMALCWSQMGRSSTVLSSPWTVSTNLFTCISVSQTL